LDNSPNVPSLGGIKKDHPQNLVVRVQPKKALEVQMQYHQKQERVFHREARIHERKRISIRRRIHSNPELSYREFDTAKLVAANLRSLGIEVRTSVGGTGVVGILRGSNDNDENAKVVALRADMDALPVQENVDLPFKSKKNGIMHACGHDTHVAMLLGAAMILSNHRKDLKGVVKFLFQPAEEDGGRGGAEPMIKDGAMQKPKVDYVFGIHIMTDLPARTFGTRSGVLMAAPNAFKIKIIGRGGHGSRPHETIDPIFISAQVICALQAISSRLISPAEPFVISVCNIHSGSKDNIIPDDAIIEGTIRTVSENVRLFAKKEVRKITESICDAFGAKCEIDFLEDAYPVTYNDEKCTAKTMELLGSIKGTRTIETPVRLEAEDFSRFLQKAPGTFYFLGSGNPKKNCVYPNHSSKFKVDESVLKYGALSLAMLALAFAKNGSDGDVRA
jgi:carboxypeptidase Ss1